MQRTLRWFFGFGLLFAAAAGCSANQGCFEYARAFCTQQSQCSAFGSLYYQGSFEQCQTSVAESCALSTHAAGSNLTDDLASTCAQAFAVASCDDVLDGNQPAACRVPGSRAVGQPCADAFQCQSLFCSRRSPRDCGTCAVLPKVGEPCTASGFCDYGLECVSSTCAARRGPGEVCDGYHHCQGSLGCLKGSCQTSTIGAACDAGYDCNQYQLQYCDGSTLSCQSLPFVVAQLGESCGNGSDVTVQCPPAAYCKTMGSTDFGICTAMRIEGESCAPVNQLCASPATCISGICRLFDVTTCN
jgi:hypothetical protein